MGRKCSVPGCRTGYRTSLLSEKITVYRFPTKKEECQRWVDSMPEKLDKITKYMGICALHWSADSILNNTKCVSRYLTPSEPPSIFPEIGSSNAPKPRKKDPYLSKTVDANQFDPNCSKTMNVNQLDDLKEPEPLISTVSEWHAKYHSSPETESFEDHTDDCIEETILPTGNTAAFSNHIEGLTSDTIEETILPNDNTAAFSKHIAGLTSDAIEETILPNPNDNNMIASTSIKNDQQSLEGEAIHFSIKTEESNKPADIIIKLTFLWCNHCDFVTDSKQDLVTHISNKHMKTCPQCPFRSMSQADLTRHIECEHNNRLQVDCLSDTETDMDPVSACEFCSFMSYSTEHLHKHTSVEHPGMLPRTSSKIVLKYISGWVRQADYLFYSCLLNKTCEGGDVLDPEPQFISTDVRIQGTPLSPKQEEESFSCGIDQNFCGVPANAFELSSNACPTITRDMSDESLFQNECFISLASTTSVRITDNHDVKRENIQDDQILDDLSLSSKNLEIASLPHEGIFREKPSLQMRIDSSNQLSENEPEDIDSQSYDGGDDGDDDDKSLMPFPSDQLKGYHSGLIKSQEENLEVTAPVAVGLKAFSLLEEHVRQQGRDMETGFTSKLKLRPVVQLERLPDSFDACNVTRSTREKLFPCTSCDKSFKTYDNLVDHNRIHSPAEPYKCQLCDNTYTEKTALDWHMHWHATKELMEKKEKDVLEERKQKKEIFIQQKQERERALALRKKIRKEKPKVHVRTPCEVCGKMLSPSGLARHKLVHQGIRPHVCDLCGRGFFTLGSMKVHRVVHMTERPHECHLCQKRFKLLKHMKYHIQCSHLGRKRKKRPVGRQHKCTLCDQSYVWPESLRDHMSKHTGERAFLCNICGKSFVWAGGYRTHMAQHNGKHLPAEKRHRRPVEKRHKCDKCELRFKSYNLLQKHLLSHEELPYKCKTCQKRFRYLKSCQIHMDRNRCRSIIVSCSDFICSLCNKSFHKRIHVRNHERLVHKLLIKQPTSQNLTSQSQIKKEPAGISKSNAEIEKQPSIEESGSDTCTANNDLSCSNTEKES